MITKRSKRKTRSKLRKPKYLSLRLDLTPSPPMPTTTDNIDNPDNKQLINLFPLHPENLMEQDKLDMSCIFSSCDDDGAATTLTGILCSGDEDEDEDGDRDRDRDEDMNLNNPSPSSVNYAEEEVELVRTAMRRNKMDKNDHDQKFVCYSEVVERNKGINIRGMSSSSSSNTSCYYHYDRFNNDYGNHSRSKLVLKLDYEKIMKSWVNKGPLYIGGSNSDPQPQTVPDIQDDDFFFPSSINGTTHNERDNGGNRGMWTVPEMTQTENNRKGGEDEALQAEEPSEILIHNREASVQRYKEKRRNRLFSKTIRYEVRKLNAEKRPRIKGRFVKRS